MVSLTPQGDHDDRTSTRLRETPDSTALDKFTKSRPKHQGHDRLPVQAYVLGSTKILTIGLDYLREPRMRASGESATLAVYDRPENGRCHLKKGRRATQSAV
jgi:hypothetical protein